jgi:hypothetical protein
LPKYLRGETNVTRSTWWRERKQENTRTGSSGTRLLIFRSQGAHQWFGFSNNAGLFTGGPFPQVFEVREEKEVPEHLAELILVYKI